MNITREVSSKTNHNNNSSVMPPLPPRLQSKRLIVHSKEIKPQLSSIPHQDNTINNLSTIIKQSEKLLTPNKTIRRTSSLHIPNRDNLSNSFLKASNSHSDKLTNSNLDISRSNIQRHSLRNIEKYSGIKCSLPSGTLTVPNTFKNLEKHTTPTKPKQINVSSSMIDNQITPTITNRKVKSPWRLRFEKFLNHQELTPLSPTNDSIAFTTNNTATLNKENRTPSFRFPTRKINKIHLKSKTDD